MRANCVAAEQVPRGAGRLFGGSQLGAELGANGPFRAIGLADRQIQSSLVALVCSASSHCVGFVWSGLKGPEGPRGVLEDAVRYGTGSFGRKPIDRLLNLHSAPKVHPLDLLTGSRPSLAPVLRALPSLSSLEPRASRVAWRLISIREVISRRMMDLSGESRRHESGPRAAS